MSTENQARLTQPCANADELWNWLRDHLHIEVPRVPFCARHRAPFDYLKLAYFDAATDLVVWGPRGGGKTRLAAAATLLDLLHKPGVQVRILGGSLEQSLRVWEHLLPDVENLAEDELEGTRSRARKLTLRSGAHAAVLTQSQRAVRGQRVQKMRCDEVELFDPRVWDAVGPTTRSLTLPSGHVVRGAVEAFSTHHRPYGLMGKIIQQATDRGSELIQWCILDVMAKCPAEKPCDTCELLPECGRRAKTDAHGFVPVEDVIAIKRRVSTETWESELLCHGPDCRGRVFPHFRPDIHVTDFDPAALGIATYVLGVDFGYVNPFVALWAARGPKDHLYVWDEYVHTGRTVAENLAAVRARPWHFDTVHCDPAGNGKNEQTGESSVAILKAAALKVRSRSTRINDGVEEIRTLIRPAFGPHRLHVHPRCKTLIKALEMYHYADDSLRETPHKDGEHDHPIDALRYWLMNETDKKNVGTRDRY